MSKEERFCTNPNEWEVLQFKVALEKNKHLYDELIQMLSSVEIEIKGVKTLNMDVSSLTDFVTNIIYNNYSNPKDEVNKKEPMVTQSDVYDDVVYKVAL